MDNVFKNIDPEKRDRIINSALEEFSRNQFDKASTNNIVKNAKISKGLLFHYFNSKKELYEKLEEFTIQLIIDAIQENIDWNITDFFERVKQVSMIKGELIYQYPYLYDFMIMMIENTSVEELRQKSEEQSGDLVQKIYKYNIDFLKFRSDINLEAAMTIIRWTFEKFGEESMGALIKTEKEFDFKQLEQEAEKYIELLRKAFYKKEEKSE
ncbi:TetR/AcrR family transcriptional regulator [Anaerovorax sp. IOR16]|uniref:TetR/AcrR family transcriptional regulator n=1 Tax=Anaerovorax sp. IOR16 TaxID=2773458 RepID=UPI0019D23A83|nr:TetR/AcrR family transcriptional regulator [Anaerovorax sp. IOR16]